MELSLNPNEKFLRLRDGSFCKIIENIENIKTNPTFFQVIGKEHIEEIMVNTLAFFLDSKNPHTFGDLIYRNFCDAIENYLIEKESEHPELDYGKFISLEKEISFRNSDGESGRLDLIVNCENCLIGIEAKVRHFVKNPFSIYDKLLQERNELQKEIRTVILCKRGTKIESKEAEDWIIVNWEDLLIEDIDENDDYAPLWKGMKIAFRGEEILKKEDLEIVANNHEDYLLMYKMIENVSKELEKKAENIKNVLVSLIDSDNTNIRIWGRFGEHNCAEPRVVIERNEKGKTKYVVDIIVSAKGYRFLAFDRKNLAQDKTNNLLKNANFGLEKWVDFMDQKETNRALITAVPDDLSKGLEQNGSNNEFFSAKEKETEKIANLGERIYSIITNS